MDKESVELVDLRIDLAHRSKWNIGYFIAGGIFWIAVLITNWYVPIETGRILWIALSFGVLPIAVLVSKLVDADPFSNTNPLGRLVGHTHMSVIAFSFPILVVTAVYDPHIQLLATAILYSIDFYVMTWVFNTRIFGVHAAARTVAVCAIWVAFPEDRLTLIPIIVAIFYLATVISIPIARRRWITTNTRRYEGSRSEIKYM